jgi:hypothetical protein
MIGPRRIFDDLHDDVIRLICQAVEGVSLEPTGTLHTTFLADEVRLKRNSALGAFSACNRRLRELCLPFIFRTVFVLCDWEIQSAAIEQLHAAIRKCIKSDPRFIF